MPPEPSLAVAYASASGLHERILALKTEVEVRCVSNASNLDELYALRYRCYLKEGAIRANERASFSDAYDGASNVYHVGFYARSHLVAAIRIAVLSYLNDQSSSMASFSNEVTPILMRGELVIDPSRFVIDHAFSRQRPEMAYLVLRIPFMAAGFFEASTVLATVRSEHMAFYKRVLRCEKVTDPKPYLGLGTPLNLMFANYPVVAPKIIARHPSFAYSTEEAQVLFDSSRHAIADPAMPCTHTDLLNRSPTL